MVVISRTFFFADLRLVKPDVAKLVAAHLGPEELAT